MLTPVNKPFTQRRVITYDLEWVPGGNPAKAKAHGFHPLQLRLIGTFDGDRYRIYSSLDSFFAGEFTSRTSGAWYYAHAGGTADMRFLFEWLVDNQHKYRVQCLFRGSSAMIVKIRRGNLVWTLIDSYFLIRQPLRKIGEWMGQAKGGESNSTDMFYAPWKELCDYNEQDNRILYSAIKTFETTLNELGSGLEVTVASSALALFRRSYLKRKVRQNLGVNEHSRQSYIASRVEVFQQDVTAAGYWDINSSFPHEMTHAVPGDLVRRDRTIPSHELYLARARVRVPECYLPPLPYRSRTRRLYFPWGEWDGWFTGVDLSFLEEMGGTIMNVHDVYHFAPLTDLSDYATDIYERRRTATSDAYKQVLKILLNSLYGKFAESDEKRQILINPTAQALSQPGMREVIPGVWEQTESKTPPHAIVPISAHITARARRSLTRYMAQSPVVYYCDTDGFAVPESVKFPESDALGGLKFEKPIWHARFEAPKLYAIKKTQDADYDIKAKGFSRIRDGDGDRRITYKDFCDLIDHRDLEIAHFQRIREGLRDGNLSPTENPIQKTYLGKHKSKRRYIPGGNSVPRHVGEIDD